MTRTAAFSQPLKHLVLWLFDHPRKAVTLILLLLVVSGMALTRIKIDTGVVTLVGHESPSFKAYESFTDVFGHDFYALVTVSADDVLSRQNLERLRALHRDIQANTPHIERVVSLINVPRPHNNNGRVVLSGALMPWPDTDEALQARQQAILDYPPYHNFLVNPQRDFTLVVIQLRKHIVIEGEQVAVSVPQYAEVAESLKQTIRDYQADDFQLTVTGEAATNAAVERAFVIELLVLGSASYAFGVILLWLIFRRTIAVILPGLVIATTIVITFACMALAGAPLQLTSSIIPPLIVGLGVADAVHLLNAFFRHQGNSNSRREAFSKALDETLGPILLTSLTTAVGLLSFCLVQVYALSGFGLFAAVATLIAFLMTFLLAAPFIALLPDARDDNSVQLFGKRDAINAVARHCVAFAGRHPGRIILGTALAAMMSAYALSSLKLNHDTLDWLPQDWQELRGMKLVDQHFSAASSFELIIDSGERNGVLDPQFIHSVRSLSQRLTDADNSVFSSVRSIDEYMQQISLAMDGRILNYHEHDNAADLIWRDMRLFQIGMRNEFAALVSQDYRYIRLTAPTSRHWAMEFDTPRRQVQQALASEPTLTSVAVTGLIPILRETLDVIIAGAISSFIQSMLAITVLLVFFFRSMRIGLLAMLPNVTPIMLVLALLSAAGATLDMITIMIGSLVIGVIVDDTIHFVSNFRHAMAQGQAPAASCEYALSTSGHAMLVTSVVLIGSFAIMGISQLENIQLFATISSSILALGLAADFLVMPAIMQWLYRHQP